MSGMDRLVSGLIPKLHRFVRWLSAVPPEAAAGIPVPIEASSPPPNEGEKTGAALDFGIGPTYSTAAGEAGRRCLGAGWSHGEDEFTWSDGDRAEMTIPLAEEPPPDSTIHVRIHGIRVGGAWVARVFAGGALARIVTRADTDPYELTFDVPVTAIPSGDGKSHISLAFEFENLLCPADAGISIDARRLSLALKSFELWLHVEGTDAAAELKSILAARQSEVAIAFVDSDHGSEGGVSALLERSGLRGLLMLYDQAAPHRSTGVLEQAISTKKSHSPNLEIVEFNNPMEEILLLIFDKALALDLIVVDDPAKLEQVINILSDLNRDQNTPDILILSQDTTCLHHMFTKNPDNYEKTLKQSTTTFLPHSMYFDRTPSNKPTPYSLTFPYGTMVAMQDRHGVRVSVPGESSHIFLVQETAALFRYLMASSGPLRADHQRTLIIHTYERAYSDCDSVAFGRLVGASPAIRLVPDPWFFNTFGYKGLRDAATGGMLPNWSERKNVVFWRGSAHDYCTAVDGTPIERVDQVPRVVMCLALRDHPGTDAAIYLPGRWKQDLQLLQEAGIYRPALPMLQHADYRFLIDIDGAANAWSFFEKLLLGCCILKVRSVHEQWFYSQIAEWEHFVPVAPDQSDLFEKIEWCQTHQNEARDIAARSQGFALQHSYEIAREMTIDAVKAATREDAVIG